MTLFSKIQRISLLILFVKNLRKEFDFQNKFVNQHMSRFTLISIEKISTF